MEEWVDVTITHPWKRSGRDNASKQQGIAVDDAAKRKHSRYGERAGGLIARPFAVETWGRCAPEANELLDVLCGAWAEKVGATAARSSAKMRQWREDLGCALMRAMACTVRCAPTGGRWVRSSLDFDDEGILDVDAEQGTPFMFDRCAGG